MEEPNAQLDVMAVIGGKDSTPDGRSIKYINHLGCQEVTIALAGISRAERTYYHRKVSIALAMYGYKVEAKLPKARLVRAMKDSVPDYATTILMLWLASKGWDAQLVAPELGLSLVCVQGGFAVFGDAWRRAEACRQGQERGIQIARHAGYDVWHFA